ncbi:hypothetical protein [Vreelandella rituensis]|uniref:hypothetical protein n=1 Tax=Vreelandella rituensis TaxID=2282306 RepID=UPI0011C02E31|nr:hypothetical protein [Halomonas rituensis]
MECLGDDVGSRLREIHHRHKLNTIVDRRLQPGSEIHIESANIEARPHLAELHLSDNGALMEVIPLPR